MKIKRIVMVVLLLAVVLTTPPNFSIVGAVRALSTWFDATAKAEPRIVTTFRDFENNKTEFTEENNSFVSLKRGHSYECRITYDLADTIDLTKSRVSIFIPSRKAGGFTSEYMYVTIEDLNGNVLLRRDTTFGSDWYTYVAEVTSPATFFNEYYPDGTCIDDKIFSDGVILEGVKDVNKGYISFNLNCRKPKTAFSLRKSASVAGIILVIAYAVYHFYLRHRNSKEDADC